MVWDRPEIQNTCHLSVPESLFKGTVVKSIPYAPRMVYLPTFGWFLGQMLVNIPAPLVAYGYYRLLFEKKKHRFPFGRVKSPWHGTLLRQPTLLRPGGSVSHQAPCPAAWRTPRRPWKPVDRVHPPITGVINHLLSGMNQLGNSNKILWFNTCESNNGL